MRPRIRVYGKAPEKGKYLILKTSCCVLMGFSPKERACPPPFARSCSRAVEVGTDLRRVAREGSAHKIDASRRREGSDPRSPRCRLLTFFFREMKWFRMRARAPHCVPHCVFLVPREAFAPAAHVHYFREIIRGRTPALAASDRPEEPDVRDRPPPWRALHPPNAPTFVDGCDLLLIRCTVQLVGRPSACSVIVQAEGAAGGGT